MTAVDTLVQRTTGLQPWRRIFHAGTGAALAAALLVLEPPQGVTVVVLTALTAAAFLLDGLRLLVPALNRLFFLTLRHLASPREAAGTASSSWYLLGCLLAVAIFPREVAAASILVLALADPAACWVGRRWGRRRLGTGSVLGGTVFLLCATVVLVPFVGFAVAFPTAMAAAAAELAPWPVDDNLVIPLLTGAVLWSLQPLGF